MRTEKMLADVTLLLLALGSLVHAQDVHVQVKAGVEITPTNVSQFPTVQYAMDHSPQPGPGGRLFVHIAPGVYAERVKITANRPRTTFLGDPEDPAKVVITAAQNAGSAGGTFFSETVDVEAPGFAADGITFQNTWVAPGQAVAIAVRSDRAIFKHCRFIGDQDTLFADFGRQFYTESYIAGGVDFIFGNATAVFDHVELHETRAGYLTAQSRTGPDEATGYVIANSRVTAEDFGGKPFFLGRPWRPYSRVIVVDTVLPSQLSSKGWSPWRESEVPAQTTYAEFRNTGPGAEASQRVGWSRQLSSKEVSQYRPSTFLRGADEWDPIREAALLP